MAEIDAIVGEIAASAREQAVGLDQVNTAVNQMDQVTQQNAAMVEQSTAASHALVGEAQDLDRMLGQFELGLATAGPGRAGPSPQARGAGRHHDRPQDHGPGRRGPQGPAGRGRGDRRRLAGVLTGRRPGRAPSTHSPKTDIMTGC